MSKKKRIHKNKRQDFDSPWKEALGIYFKQFVEICHSEIAREIDWSKGYEALDKELISITKGSEFGQKRVDKLIRVWRKGGDEIWVLLHIEVQNTFDKNFEKRMYVSNYRIFDRYNKPVVSIAILADGDLKWHPQSYREDLWGCGVTFNFFTIKLLDYLQKYHELDESKNPFAMIILAQLEAIRTQGNVTMRYEKKTALTKSLYRKGLGKEELFKLYRLIDWLLALPEKLALEYHLEIERHEEKTKMPYITTAERIGIKKGIEQGKQEGMQQGKQEGMQQGKQEGMQQGMHKGEALILARQLQRKFQKISEKDLDRLKTADEKTLLLWAERLIEAKILEDIFKTNE